MEREIVATAFIVPASESFFPLEVDADAVLITIHVIGFSWIPVSRGERGAIRPFPRTLMFGICGTQPLAAVTYEQINEWLND